MKLLKLSASRYRSLRDESIEFDDLNLFIGANASGKSTILDALRFLHEGVQARDFRVPVLSRGGIVNLAWKGEEARQIELVLRLENQRKTYEWSVRLVRDGHEFYVQEHVLELPSQTQRTPLLDAEKGEGGWWSGEKGERVLLKQAPTSCALAAAAADASFLARDVAEFVGRWGFFDPNPFLLRRDWTSLDSAGFDPYGRNLGETLYSLGKSSPEVFDQIVSATQSVVRRVKPAPGSQLALFATYSYHGFITDRDGETLELEADHRRHAEIENAIRDLKYGVGLNHLPSGRFAANGAWLAVQVMAHNLARWTARIGLGQQIVTTKTLRRRVFALVGRITRSARRLTLHLPRRWPWEEQFSRALARLRAIPLPA